MKKIISMILMFVLVSVVLSMTVNAINNCTTELQNTKSAYPSKNCDFYYKDWQNRYCEDTLRVADNFTFSIKCTSGSGVTYMENYVQGSCMEPVATCNAANQQCKKQTTSGSVYAACVNNGFTRPTYEHVNFTKNNSEYRSASITSESSTSGVYCWNLTQLRKNFTIDIRWTNAISPHSDSSKTATLRVAKLNNTCAGNTVCNITNSRCVACTAPSPTGTAKTAGQICCPSTIFENSNKCYNGTQCVPNQQKACASQFGVCLNKNETCDILDFTFKGCSAANVPNYEATEISCDGLDNNCDGNIDTDTNNNPITKSCYDGLATTANIGICHGGTSTCVIGSGYGSCANQQLPLAPACNGLDNNCDGLIDRDKDNDGYNDSSVCTGRPNELPDCNDNVFTTHPNAMEICDDNVDNDCDGVADEFCATSPLLYFIDQDGSKFRSCNFPEKTLTAISNTFWYDTSDGNLKNENVCKNLGSWYCEYDSNWKDAFKYDANKPINTTKDNSLISNNWPYDYADINNFDINIQSNLSCCPASFCFNGSINGCENSLTYINNPKKPPIFTTYGETGYRCNAAGNWTVVSLKKDYNRNDSGYCNENSECYATADQACYKSGQWGIVGGKDRMCWNGNWTTRAKYIAYALLNYTQSNNIVDYVLYCDNLSNALGNPVLMDINYKVFDNYNFNPYFFGACSGQDCVNNLCVLKFGTSVIIGTSLNKPLNATPHPLYEAFGFNISTKQVTSYDNGDNITLMFSSSKSGNLYYSSNKQVIFYSANSGIANFQATLGEQIMDIFLHPIRSIISLINGIVSNTQAPSSVLDKVADFDKVYFAKTAGKTVFGIQETKYDENTSTLQTFISLNYTGFTSDICKAVLGTNLGCNSSTTIPPSTYVYGFRENQLAFSNIWPDLTAKLRIS